MYKISIRNTFINVKHSEKTFCQTRIPQKFHIYIHSHAIDHQLKITKDVFVLTLFINIIIYNFFFTILHFQHFPQQANELYFRNLPKVIRIKNKIKVKI